MDKKFDLRHLDVLSFARDASRLEGQSDLADWSRLADELYGSPPSVPVRVVWQLQGHTAVQADGTEQIWLNLQASVDLPMQCQRCLTPVLQTVKAERAFRFVADEATAEALDDEAEEDILALSRDFDAAALVEDELILSLPLVPLHEQCPVAVPMTAIDPAFEEAAARPNPFGVLAGLKTGKPH